MNEELQRDLLKRSLELKLPWCSIYPAQWRNFKEKGWVLIIDDRHPPRRTIFVVPLHHLALMQFPSGKPKRRKKKA